MKDKVICTQCHKDLIKTMEIEYSEYLSAYFCDPDCARDHYFEYMQSGPLDIENMRNGTLFEKNVLMQKFGT